jgi:urea transport system substrate-binding protein
LLGSREIEEVVAKIVRSRPDVILNTINGDSNIEFFRSLRAAGIAPGEIPTLSFSLGENELAAMGAALSVGDYAAWSYFQSVDSETNRDFVRRFKDRYGNHRVVSDPMEAAYVGVHLWASAVVRANTDLPASVRLALADQSMAAPEGIVYVDAETQHLWKPVHIGQVRVRAAVVIERRQQKRSRGDFDIGQHRS